MQIRNRAGKTSVHLFGIRRIFVICAQSCLNVTDFRLIVKRRERADKGSAGVAVNKHNVGFCLVYNVIKTGERICCNGQKRLSVFHNIQIVIGCDVENFKHLVEHLSVLCCNRNDRLNIFVFFKLLYKRSHFYSLGTCPENRHNFNHFFLLLFPCRNFWCYLLCYLQFFRLYFRL